jgi:hypothetical protein
MLTYARFLLYPGEVLCLDSTRTLRVCCESGRLWLTAGGEGIDHDLGVDHFAEVPGGRLLIEGEGVAVLRVEAPHRCRRAVSRLQLLQSAINPIT